MYSFILVINFSFFMGKEEHNDLINSKSSSGTDSYISKAKSLTLIQEVT